MVIVAPNIQMYPKDGDPVGLPVISTELICSKLCKLDPYKSPGPDGWPLWALQETADSICIPLLFFTPGHWILKSSPMAGKGVM